MQDGETTDNSDETLEGEDGAAGAETQDSDQAGEDTSGGTGDDGLKFDTAPGDLPDDMADWPEPMRARAIKFATEHAEAKAKPFQADYTRKTQDLADRRRALDEERRQLDELRTATPARTPEPAKPAETQGTQADPVETFVRKHLGDDADEATVGLFKDFADHLVGLMRGETQKTVEPLTQERQQRQLIEMRTADEQFLGLEAGALTERQADMDRIAAKVMQGDVPTLHRLISSYVTNSPEAVKERIEKARKDAVAEHQKNLKDKKTHAPTRTSGGAVPTGAPGPLIKKPDESDMQFRERVEAAHAAGQ